VYISTAYVFDGTKPPYCEDDVPNPLNEYGETKLAGEKAALENHSGAIVLRVPSTFGSQLEFQPNSQWSLEYHAVHVVLYGFVETIDESAVITLAKCLFGAKVCA
jgi:dTDP-4-dehydrorhamnose reductase